MAGKRRNSSQFGPGWGFWAVSLTDALLKEGLTIGRARMQVKAKAVPLALPALPLAKNPSVVAELRTSDGKCWGARFSTATKNDLRQFSARSD